MSPILGIWASAVTGGVSTTSFESIATVSVGSGGASSVTFSSIPSTYTHLQIRCITRGGGSQIQFNSDTGANYTRHYVYGNGTSVQAGGGGGNSGMSIIDYTSQTNTFGAAVVDILDYTSTNKYKTARSLTGFDTNGAVDQEIFLFGGMWLNTSAITTITISGGSIAQYSHFALYGIKGA
jgi:hypothetical protein